MPDVYLYSGEANPNDVKLRALSNISIAQIGTGSGNGSAVVNLTALPPNCLLVLATCNNSVSVDNCAVSSSPSLVWTKRVDDGVINGDNAEIWTAPFPAGGTIAITADWPSTEQAAVCYALLNVESVLAGASGSANSQALPSVAVTTTKANSLLICITADFNGQDGTARVYRDGATEALYYRPSGAITAYSYYKQTTAIGTYTEGLTAPAFQIAVTVVLEVRDALSLGSSGTTYPVDITEAGSGTEVSDALKVLIASITEAGAATESESVLLTTLAAIVESGTATETESALLVTLAAIVESGSGTEVESAVKVLVAAIVEAATGTEVSDAVKVLAASITGSGTATEVESAVLTLLATITESGSATEIESAVKILAAAITEAGTATEVTDAVKSLVASITESGTATEVSSATQVLLNSITESGSATEVSNAAKTLAALITESVSATETQDATFVQVVDITEAATATDISDSVETDIASIGELADATETEDATLEVTVFVDENTTADDIIDAIISHATPPDTNGGGGFPDGGWGYPQGVSLDDDKKDKEKKRKEKIKKNEDEWMLLLKIFTEQCQ